MAYENLWPRTDVVFYGTGAKLEYDFIVRPGGDPSRIEFAYQGIRNLSLGRNGDLLLETRLGQIPVKRPFTYQAVDGQRRVVESRFVVRQRGDETAIGISIGDYDERLPLVIDPGLVFSSVLGPVIVEGGHAIAVGPDGSAYVAGSTWTNDFPTTAGAYQTKMASAPAYDAFVAKFDPTGSRLVYSTFLGGGQDEYGNALVVDGDGSVYVAGRTDSRDFPTSRGAFDRTFNSVAPYAHEGDAFVTHLNASGTALLGSTFLGGSSRDAVYSVGRGGGGVQVGGETDSPNFPATPGAYDTEFDNVLDSPDAFIARLTPDLKGLSYATFLGGVNDDFLREIAVDATGNVVAVGLTRSSDFPTTPGAFDRDPNLPEGAPYTNYISETFVTKLDASGSTLSYSTFLGGSSREDDEEAISVALGADGSAYVAGYTFAEDFPVTPGAYRTTFQSPWDQFVARLDPSGSSLLFSSFAGGQLVDVDSSGSVYVVGRSLEKLDATGSTLVYATDLGVDAYGMAVDDAGVVYVTGDRLGGSGSRTATRSEELTSLQFGTTATALVHGIVTACTVEGSPAAEELVGTAHRDVICGAGGNDVIRAGGGSDIILDEAGASILNGGTGADTILGHDGNDILIGGPGGDRLDGGSGSDGLRGEAGNDLLLGRLGDDILSGSYGIDRLLGGDGLDRLFGASGRDTLLGGDHRDFLSGGSESDRLFGNGARDRLYGGAGNDRLHGGPAADVCAGGPGGDLLLSC